MIYGEATALHGHIAEPDHTPAPCVLVAHMWGGRVRFVDERADALSRLGYLGFAIDIYGEGRTGSSAEENAALMQPFLDDRGLLRRRLRAAIDAAREHPACDGRVAIIGYCFGGLCALEAARMQTELSAVVSIHGLLNAPERSGFPGTDYLLLLHGEDDPMVSQEDLAATRKELQGASLRWRLVSFGGAMHAFTNPAANDRSMGTVYEPVAAAAAWRYTVDFLAEAFSLK